MNLKMHEVITWMAQGRIKDGAVLCIIKSADNIEKYTYKAIKKDGVDNSFFLSEHNIKLDLNNFSNIDLLNKSVSLTNPRETEYFIKVNIAGMPEEKTYLNYYYIDDNNNELSLGLKDISIFIKSTFTMSDMEGIKDVREFLEDMKGKYELIEVDFEKEYEEYGQRIEKGGRRYRPYLTKW